MTAPKRRRPGGLLAAAVALTLLSACGSGDSSELTTIEVSGSSTVEPISTRVAELFEDRNPNVFVNVDGPGTGDGFELFCNGETDISDASRPIKEEEIASCEENGVEFIELRVAFDGIAVMTSPATGLECLSFADMYALVGPESQGFDEWSDAEDLAAELGSDTELPDGELEVTAPGEESGTYDAFVELVLDDIAEERGEEAEVRLDYASQGDDNAILQGIEGSDGSFGWVGFAFAEEAGDAVQELAVSAEPGGECVEPTAEAIADGTYPISRPLFIYVSVDSLERKPAVADYVEFYLHDGMSAVEEVGYVPLPPADLAAARQAFESRTTGTREG